METIKLSVEINENREVVIHLPSNIPLGKAEIMVIIQPTTNGQQQRRGEIDLASRGITPEQAAEMRNRLISFEEDWNAPGMEAYDDV